MESEYKALVVGALSTGADCAQAVNQIVATFSGLGVEDSQGPTDVEVRSIFKIDPELPEFGKLGFANPNPPINPEIYNLFWYPGIYAADARATIPRTSGLVNSYFVPDVNAASGLFFKTYPINTFRYDTQENSPTFGRATYVANQGSPGTHTNEEYSSNTGPVPEFDKIDPTKEYNVSIRAVDFDSRLISTSVAIPPPDASASPAPLSFFRNRPAPDGVNTTIQIFSWPPLPGSNGTRLIEFPISASDMPIGRTETDPYDVFGFALATPSPVPTSLPQNVPTLSGWGVRSDCGSAPPQFPLVSLLRLDTLADYKKCKLTWQQREQDAGKTFNYLIQVQDNIGADATVTPKIMGLGAKHPVSSTSSTLSIRYNPLPPGITLASNSSIAVRFSTDPPDGPNPGTTMDDTLPSCAASGICFRNRIWTSVPAQNCNHTTRVCTINVSQQYKLHFIEVSRSVVTLANGTTSNLVETFEEQPRPSVPMDSLPLANGPLDVFNLQIFSLEHNQAPFFTDSTGNTLSNAIYSGPGTGNWSAISLPPSCSSGSSGGFQCSLRVNAGDTLWNSPATATAQPTPYQLQERSTPYTDFRIHVKDIANLADLKTLSVIQPTQVLILDGPNAGLTYSVPSFSNSSLINWQVQGSVGSAVASFQWAPTDLEANLLSNPGGFLIPIKVRDRPYNPQPSETNFPTQFTVPSTESTIWIWCRLSVVNNAPLVQYMIPASTPTGAPTWRDLSNATLEVNTGVTNTVTVRILDADSARYRLSSSERSLGFFQSTPLAGTATTFMTAGTPAAPAGNPNETNPTSVVQTLVLTATPTNSNLGSHTATITVRDPGDPSLGLAILPGPESPPRAGLASALTSVSFNVNVVGRPFFIVPPLSTSTSTPIPRASSLKGSGAFSTFDFPLALFVSRVTDRDTPNQTNKPHFIGIQIKPAVMPANTVSNSLIGKGFRVNQDYVLKGRFDSSDLTGDRTITLGSVPISTNLALGCTPALQSTSMNDTSILANSGIAASLKRINENTGAVEYCNLNATNASNLLSQASLIHSLLDGSTSQPFATPANVTLSGAKLDRSIVASNLTSVNSEYLDFSKRCTEFCSGVPGGNGGFSLTGDEINGYTPPTSTFSPALVYPTSSGGRSATFTLNDQNIATKTYIDHFPQTNSVMNSFVLKGEQLALSVQLANPPSAQGIQARWYVNGCLRRSESLTTNTSLLGFNMAVPSTGGGLNNDCSGQYSRTENGGGFLGIGRPIRPNQSGGYLGDLIISLVLANPSEGISSTTDGSSSKTYAFHLNVVNTLPRVMTETDPRLRAAPIAVSSSSVNVTTASAPNGIPSKFILPFEFGTTSLYSYVGRNSLTGTALGNPYNPGTSIHVREFTLDGSVGGTGTFRRDVLCSGYEYAAAGSEPNQFMFGLDDSAGLSNLKIATSTYGNNGTITQAYPTGNNTTLRNKNSTCWYEFSSQSTGTLAGSAVDNVGEKSGRILAFSRLRLGSRGATMWVPPAATASSNVNPFLIEGTRGRAQFWSDGNSMANSPNIYSTLPSSLANFPNNIITKSLVHQSSNRLIQLVGLRADQFSGFNGAVLISSLSTPNGSTLNASVQDEILFGQGSCTFQGADKTYPIDGVYHPAEDILFMVGIELPDSGPALGKVIEIRNFLNPGSSTPRNCRLAGAILTPSRDTRNHNPSNLRLVVDERNGMLWGVSSGNDLTSGQAFNYDYRSKRQIFAIPLDFQPGAILISPLINGVHLFSPGSGTAVPRLLRVW
ncbi:MAG: hypothetical protein KGP28_11605 [Bdellovibrionales bacterium]|nr:hypothetical protein [Bdellovibrionales bacterium]